MIVKALYKTAAFLIRLILGMNGGITVIGRENIPMQGGVLIAANHISYLDPPLIGAIMPRMATFMARKGLFEIPVLSLFIRQVSIPVDRQRPRPSTIKEAVRRLRSGEAVVLFPEGRRSDTGELLEGKRGAGMLVSLSGVPVVPTLVIGADKALPVDAKWLKRARITVVFGKPIYYTSTKKEADNEQDEISREIMTVISDMQKQYASSH